MVEPRAVLFAGGWMHEAAPVVDAARALCTHRGLALEVITDPAQIAAVEPPELLIVASCWFSMSDARYTDDDRAGHALAPNPERRAAVARLRHCGVPLLALHTAVICFDDDPNWAAWLGGCWDWASSHHPVPSPMTIGPAPDSPIQFEPFTLVDEHYQDVAVNLDIEPIAIAGNGHPLVWRRRSSTERVVVDLLGHDDRSLGDAQHRALLGRLLDWLLDDTND